MGHKKKPQNVENRSIEGEFGKAIAEFIGRRIDWGRQQLFRDGDPVAVRELRAHLLHLALGLRADLHRHAGPVAHHRRVGEDSEKSRCVRLAQRAQNQARRHQRE